MSNSNTQKKAAKKKLILTTVKIGTNKDPPPKYNNEPFQMDPNKFCFNAENETKHSLKSAQ